MREVLENAGVDVAYAEVVDPATLLPSNDFESGDLASLVAGISTAFDCSTTDPSRSWGSDVLLAMDVGNTET
jgi:hypothetical protein